MASYKELVQKLTLAEKASLCSGQNFWNTQNIDEHQIPGFMVTDGPHGLRKQGAVLITWDCPTACRLRVFQQRQDWRAAGIES